MIVYNLTVHQYVARIPQLNTSRKIIMATGLVSTNIT